MCYNILTYRLNLIDLKGAFTYIRKRIHTYTDNAIPTVILYPLPVKATPFSLTVELKSVQLYHKLYPYR